MRHDYSSIGFYTFDCLARPVTHIPDGGGVAYVPEIALAVSGTAGSCAVAAARMGLSTLAVGAVGDDEMAGWVLDTIARAGADISAMQRVAGVGTSTSIVLTRADGTRPYIHMKGATGALWLEGESLDRAIDARVVHLGGTGLMDRLDGAPSANLLRRARERGAVTTLDLISGTAEQMGIVAPLLPHTDYFIPSIEEAQALSGAVDHEDAARFFLERGAQCTVLTLGGDGAYYRHADGRHFLVPAYDIEVVDTCGCGDAFDAGFATALCRGMDPETAVRFAQAAAALVATRLGSNAGIRSFEHTLEFMQTAPVKDAAAGRRRAG